LWHSADAWVVKLIVDDALVGRAEAGRVHERERNARGRGVDSRVSAPSEPATLRVHGFALMHPTALRLELSRIDFLPLEEERSLLT
jgi:hypothetical protein